MARLLTIVYYFPPWGGGPVLRTLKFVKYLSRMGWHIRVLTVRPEYYEPISYDSSLLSQIEPPTQLVRTASLQPRGRISAALVGQAIGSTVASSGLAKAVMPIARMVHGLLIPDDKVLWIPHAFTRGLRLITEHRPDAVFVSAPPHSATLLALALCMVTRTPLVVDFRDDWVTNPLYDRGLVVRRRLEAAMEAAVVRRAEAVILPTLPALISLRARYALSSSRFHLVPNGFDEEDVGNARLVKPLPGSDGGHGLRCIYAGLLNERRDLSTLLQAMQRIESRTPGAITLSLAGFVPESVVRTINDLGLQERVERLGYLSHVDVLRHILSADVALLVSTAAEGAQTAIPSKLYEYVACGTHVLGLVDAGATADMVRENRWGTICEPSDVGTIEQTLLALLRRKQIGTLRPDVDRRDIEAYTRRGQAEKLNEILRGIL